MAKVVIDDDDDDDKSESDSGFYSTSTNDESEVDTIHDGYNYYSSSSSNHQQLVSDTSALIEGYIRSNFECSKSIIQIIHMYYIKHQIFGIGYNKEGTFGLNHTKNLKKFTSLNLIQELVCDIKQISFWENRIFIQTIDNEIYTAGDSNWCNKLRTTFTKINPNLFCDDDDNLLIPKFIASNTGLLYTESNDIFPLIRIFNESVKKESKIMRNIIGVKDIECGSNYTLILSESGDVFIYGYNTNGYITKACGLSEEYHIEKDIETPLLVKLPNNNCKINKISVGMNKNLMLDIDGKLIIFGSNENGVLGIDENIILNVELPVFHPFFCEKMGVKIIDINSLWYGGLVIDEELNCYMFGNNIYGMDQIRKPHKIIVGGRGNIDKFVKGVCGFMHTLLLSKCNEIISFGNNMYNQCSSIINNKYISSPNIVNKSIELNIPNTGFIQDIIAFAHRSIVIINPSGFTK